MKKSKILLLGLVSLMVSCGGGSAIDPNPDLTVDVNNRPSDLVLETYFPASGFTDDEFKNGYIAKRLEELTGYKAVYNQTGASGDKTIGNLLNNKDHVNMMKFGSTLFSNYVADGYFTDLTEVINKYAPELKDLILPRYWEAVTYNGKIYGIPEAAFSPMKNNALIWNMDHLNKVGITKVPETITEFDTAVNKLQKHFGEELNNTNYHAYGLPGTNSKGSLLCNVFEVPFEFFEDEKGEIQNLLFSKNTENYVTYMNSLNNSGALAKSWTTMDSNQIQNSFVSGNTSVMEISYWQVESLKAKLMSTEDYKNNREKVDATFLWNEDILGDGAFNSIKQDKPISRNGVGIAYYLVVPVAAAKEAAYVVDWINKRLKEEPYQTICAGTEGVHFAYCDASDPDAVKLNTEDGNTYAKTLEPKFSEDILSKSQYQTGGNTKIGQKFWPLQEKAFNAWSVLTDDSDQLLENPIQYHPFIESYAKVELNAQNYVVTGLQSAISPKSGKTSMEVLEQYRSTYNSKYWKDNVKNDINNWYKSYKESL